ncbi:MAG TPA: hypothetical protein VMW04_01980 [Patescibacteria group bacterium]|nr:hypothetical protein [Patescibacteria group bacterium]
MVYAERERIPISSEKETRKKETRKVVRILREIREERGRAVEERAREAFWNFIGSSDCPPWLTGYLPAQGTLADEDGGVDGYVFTDMDEIEIQIKSSPKGVAWAKKTHPKVPVFCVESTYFSDSEIMAIFLPRLRKIRNRRYNQARRQTQSSTFSLCLKK